MKQFYIILGSQGSGKGTQAKILAKNKNLAYFSAGEEIKRLTEEDKQFAKIGAKYYKKGNLLPTNQIKKILINGLKKLDLKNGLVLEGFPRSYRQIHVLDLVTKQFDLPKPVVIHLKTKRSTVLERIGKRKVCAKCGKSAYPKDKKYNSNICDVCQGKLITRPDDKPKIIQHRLAIYRKQTRKVLAYYKRHKELIEVNGEPAPKIVNKEILKKISNIQAPNNK